MPINLEGIRNAFESGDFARSNLFTIEIPFLGRNFEFKCKAASLPSSTVPEVQVSYQNRKIKIAGDREFEPWTITVFNDSSQATRQQFIDWINQCQTHGLNISGENPDTYKKTATIKRFDRKGEETYRVNMFGMFPTIVGEVTLDWDDNNTVEMFQVTLAYDYFASA